jgi:hypothetical protein
LTSLVTYRGIQPALIDLMASRLLEIGSDADSSEPIVAAAQQLLKVLVERHPSHVDQARQARIASGKDTSSNLVNEDTSSMAPLLETIGVQVQGQDGDLSMVENGEDKEAAIEKIQLLLGDTNETVLQALYTNVARDAATFVAEVTAFKYIAAIVPQFDAIKPIFAVRQLHLRFIADHLDAKSLETADSVAIFSQIIFPSLLSTVSRPAFRKDECNIVGKKGFFKDHEITGSSEFAKAVEQAKSVEQGSREQVISLNLVFANAISGRCFPLMMCGSC